MWRNLNENEKEILLNKYESQKKATSWFFYLWFGIGIIIILDYITDIIRYFSSNNFSLLFNSIFTIVITYFFFIQLSIWVLKDGLKKEIDSLNKGETQIYETTLLKTRAKRKGNKKGYRYYATVNADINGEMCDIEIRTSKQVYENIQIGENVVLIAFGLKEKNNMKVFPPLDTL